MCAVEEKASFFDNIPTRAYAVSQPVIRYRENNRVERRRSALRMLTCEQLKRRVADSTHIPVELQRIITRGFGNAAPVEITDDKALVLLRELA